MTADVETLIALRERVREATEEDRGLVALACDIHACLAAKIPRGYERGASSGLYLMAHKKNGQTWSEKVPDYVRSVDAALALVERQHTGVRWTVARRHEQYGMPSSPPFFGDVASPEWIESEPGAVFHGEEFAKTPALALLAALLSAIIAEAEAKRQDGATTGAEHA